MKNKSLYIFRNCCPILEQTADGYNVGRCWYYLPDGKRCWRHGDVEVEVKYYLETGKCTLENKMRQRKGLQLLGKNR
uniref:Uncharacterized protein n=1 Tax=viral metagenome TaxID=1070528 RepID=A0A6M3LHB1_9ZZZZ